MSNGSSFEYMKRLGFVIGDLSQEASLSTSSVTVSDDGSASQMESFRVDDQITVLKRQISMLQKELQFAKKTLKQTMDDKLHLESRCFVLEEEIKECSQAKSYLSKLRAHIASIEEARAQEEADYLNQLDCLANSKRNAEDYYDAQIKNRDKNISLLQTEVKNQSGCIAYLVDKVKRLQEQIGDEASVAHSLYKDETSYDQCSLGSAASEDRSAAYRKSLDSYKHMDQHLAADIRDLIRGSTDSNFSNMSQSKRRIFIKTISEKVNKIEEEEEEEQSATSYGDDNERPLDEKVQEKAYTASSYSKKKDYQTNSSSEDKRETIRNAITTFRKLSISVEEEYEDEERSVCSNEYDDKHLLDKEAKEQFTASSHSNENDNKMNSTSDKKKESLRNEINTFRKSSMSHAANMRESVGDDEEDHDSISSYGAKDDDTLDNKVDHSSACSSYSGNEEDRMRSVPVVEMDSFRNTFSTFSRMNKARNVEGEQFKQQDGQSTSSSHYEKYDKKSSIPQDSRETLRNTINEFRQIGKPQAMKMKSNSSAPTEIVVSHAHPSI